ncbi:MAG TPA: helix-turn-helix transcriptional regulator [Vicinamibacterales bacterium]
MMNGIAAHAYRLTPQETRVLTLLLHGHHKKTAADAMGVSINTVSFHLKNAYSKLGVHSKTEAVVKGLLEGILVPVQGEAQQLTAG